MINTVIFDLDGLLVNTEIIWYQVWNDILKKFGTEFSLETYVTNHGGKTIVDNVNLLIENYNLPIDTETGVKMAKEIEGSYVEKGVDMMDGAMELLQYLKEHQYKIILGTSSMLERALKILKFHGADEYFDEFVTGYDVKRSKPFPDIFLAAAWKAGAKRNECLVLEDSEAGIQAAYAAGIPVICVPDLKEPREEYREKTTEILTSLHDVIGYLQENGK